MSQTCPWCGKGFVRLASHEYRCKEKPTLVRYSAPTTRPSQSTSTPGRLDSNPRALYAETRTRVSEPSQKCPDCGRSFKNLANHNVCHGRRPNPAPAAAESLRTNDAPRQMCPDCGKTFVNLANHKVCHGRAGQSQKCPDCGKTFLNIANHKICHGRAEQSQKCPDCGKTFVNLANHKVCHGRAEQSQKCSDCGKTFVNLANHKICHGRPRAAHPQVYDVLTPLQKCRDCGRSFKNLARHKICHGRGSPHHDVVLMQKCHDCGRSFKNIAKHKVCKGKPPKPEPVPPLKRKQKCPHCGRLYKNLEHHKICHGLREKTVQPDRNRINQVQMQKCGSCGKCFKDITKHKTCHGDTPVNAETMVENFEQCPDCGKCFKKLKRHKVCHGRKQQEKRDKKDPPKYLALETPPSSPKPLPYEWEDCEPLHIFPPTPPYHLFDESDEEGVLLDESEEEGVLLDEREEDGVLLGESEEEGVLLDESEEEGVLLDESEEEGVLLDESGEEGVLFSKEDESEEEGIIFEDDDDEAEFEEEDAKVRREDEKSGHGEESEEEIVGNEDESEEDSAGEETREGDSRVRSQSEEGATGGRAGEDYSGGLGSYDESQYESVGGYIPPHTDKPQAHPINIKSLSQVIFDLETTGFGSSSHIIQVAAMCDGSSFNKYVFPGQPITSGAERVTGLRMKGHRMYKGNQLIQSLPVKTAMKQFFDFLKSFSKPVVLVAHNSKTFDARVLITTIRNCGMIEDFQKIVFGFVDTLSLFREIYPRRKRHNLVNLYVDLIGDLFDAHDADADVVALEKLMSYSTITLSTLERHSFSVEYVLDILAYSDKKKHLLQTLDPLKGTVSTGMMEKMAGSGLGLKHLKLAFLNGGRQGTSAILGEDIGGKPRITKNKRMVDDITRFFVNNS